MRNVAVWTDQNPGSLGRGKVSGVGSAHLVKKPGAIGKSDVRHAITRVQSSENITGRQGAVPIAIVDDFVFGHALRGTASEKAVDMEFAAEQIAKGNFPRIAEVFSGGRIEIGSRFQEGLRLLLEEYGPQRPRTASTPRRNSPRRREKRK